MKENMVPTQIVNRNGVRTTVYRKPGREGTLTNSIPAPAPAQPQPQPFSRWELLDSLSLKLREVCRSHYNGSLDVDQQRIERTINGFQDATLQRLHEFLSTPAVSRSSSPPSVVAHAVARGESERLISDAMNFLPWVGKLSLIHTLRIYPQLVHRLPVETIEQGSATFRRVTALLQTADFIRQTHESNWSEDQEEAPYDVTKEYGVPVHVLKDSRLVDLILDRYEDEQRLTAVIAEHKSANYEVIAAALENGPALGSGTL